MKDWIGGVLALTMVLAPGCGSSTGSEGAEAPADSAEEVSSSPDVERGAGEGSLDAASGDDGGDAESQAGGDASDELEGDGGLEGDDVGQGAEDVAASSDVGPEGDIEAEPDVTPEEPPLPVACEDDDTCAPGLCLPTPEGSYCALPCTDTCPGGYRCAEVEGAAGEAQSVCVFEALMHCDPCLTDADCGHPLIADYGARCVSEDPAQGSFCQVPCSEGVCPAGSLCQEVEVEGAPVSLCVPEAGECTCSPRAITLEATTLCEPEGEETLCEASRTCGPEGLSACTGELATSELCDGKDNDCDGETDEGLASVGPDGTTVVGWGLPCGTGACKGGVTICGEEGDLVCSSAENISADESCDGVDDDCDGETDEAFDSTLVTTCGIGACSAEGTSACINGVEEEDCLPDLTQATSELCNAVDDDCDGFVDEEMPEEVCDGVDNDCDGETDEAPEGGTYPQEVCNGIDDDCNGLTDDGLPDQDEDGESDCVDDDIDGDGVLNEADNCPLDANEDQADEDDDDIGDLCDPIGSGDACGGFDVADVILVTTLEDELNADGDCSLREAIQAANDDVAVDACSAGSGADIISLGVQGDTFTLSLLGDHEDQNQSGDLDVHGALVIAGCGAEESTIAGAKIDRIFHVHPAASLELSGLTLRDGRATGGAGQAPAGGVGPGFGGAVYNAGSLAVQMCAFLDNEALGGAGADGQHAPGAGGGGGGGAGLGGAIYSSGDMSLSEVSFQGNVAMGGVGGKGKAHGGVSPFTGNGGGGGGPAGGAGGNANNGNAGGFGGGGGGGGGKSGGSSGAAGGFGGGGGGGGGSVYGGETLAGGAGGFGGGSGGIGCCSAAAGGGGGAGLGGAIFSDGGSFSLGVSTFSANHAYGGEKGTNHFGGPAASPGGGYGGAIFERAPASSDTALATFEGNSADTEGQDAYQSAP